jgi:hypothetical protein
MVIYSVTSACVLQLEIVGGGGVSDYEIRRGEENEQGVMRPIILSVFIST